VSPQSCLHEFWCRSDPLVVAVARAVLELIIVQNGSMSLSLGVDIAGVNSFNSRVYFVYDSITNIYTKHNSTTSLENLGMSGNLIAVREMLGNFAHCSLN